MREIRKWDDINGSASSAEKMEAFLTNENDTYAILQLKYSDETADERFASLKTLNRMGIEPTIDHYEVIYVAPLLPYKDRDIMLEGLYETFNVAHPADFRGHSLSVSDVIALRENGFVTCHYVDSVGYKELPHFLKPDNYLKNAEVTVEDDYGMIDGIINNGESEARKPSVIDQLRRDDADHAKAMPEAAIKGTRVKRPDEPGLA